MISPLQSDGINPKLGWDVLKISGLERPSRPAVKKHAVSQESLAILHEILYNTVLTIFGISLDKKIDRCHFCHHLMTSS